MGAPVTTPIATFASVDDVAGVGDPLTGNDAAYASLLLQAAALLITGKKPGIAPDDPAAKIVSIQLVRDAMDKRRFKGAPSGRVTRGSRSDEWTTARTATIEELARTLILSEYHLNLLGLWQPTGPRYVMGSRDPGPDPIRSRLWPWGEC